MRPWGPRDGRSTDARRRTDREAVRVTTDATAQTATQTPTAQTPTTGRQPRHPSVADHIVDRLSSWGVTRYFGYPGDGINGMTSALQRRPDTRFVQVRHEETAGFAATAHVKYGG